MIDFKEYLERAESGEPLEKIFVEIWDDGHKKGKDAMREMMEHLMKYTVMD